MAASAGPSNEAYDDDAARIDREYIPDDATTQAEINRALEDAGFPKASQSHISSWLVDEADAWEQVGDGVQDADSVQRELDRASRGTVSDRRAEQIADNVESEIRGSKAQTLAQSDQVTPSEAGVSDRSTPVSVIRDTSGNAVGVAGGLEDDRQAIADQEGARAYDSLQDLQDDLVTESDRTVRLGGRRVR